MSPLYDGSNGDGWFSVFVIVPVIGLVIWGLNCEIVIHAPFVKSANNDFTPQLSVLAEPEDYRVIVPSNYVTNNEIVLNISPTACDSLQLGNDVITFKARFAGKVESISIPVDRVKAIIIREEGYGMRFDVEPMKKPKMSGDQPKRGFVKVED